MATLRQAIEYSKNNPQSDKAKQLYQMIKSGRMDERAIQEGVDLTGMGRMKTGPQFQVQARAFGGQFSDIQPEEEKELTLSEDISEIRQDVVQEFQGLVSDFKQRGEEAAEAIYKGRVGGEITPLEGGFQAGTQVLGGVADMFSRATRAIVKIGLTQEQEEQMKRGMSKMAQATGVGGVVQAYDEWKEENPRLAANAEAVGRIAEFGADLVGLSTAKTGAKVVRETAETGLEVAGRAARDVAKPIQEATEKSIKAVTSPIETIKQGAIKMRTGGDVNVALKSLENAYGNVPLPKNILRAEAEEGKSFARFMAEHPHIKMNVKNNKFDTFDTAKKLREEVAEEQAAMKQLLEGRQETVSLDEVRDEVLGVVNKQLVGEEREQALRSVQREFDTLKKQFKDAGVESDGDVRLFLQDVNALKQKFWDRSPFNPTASRQDKLASNIDYRIGQSLKRSIEKNVDDADIQALNRELGDYYHSIQVLESIHGGAAPKGRLGVDMMRTAGVVAGMPGGIVGSAVGYMGAGQIAKIIMSQTVGQNIRRYIVRQLMEKRPTVAERVKDILEKRMGEQQARKLLEAPKPQLPAPKP